MKDFLTVKRDLTNEIIIEKSRFITTVKRVDGEDDAKTFVAEIKAKFPDATHNCYSYVADEGGFFVRFSDDGEPQGTAGIPMLETLKAKGLKKVAVVVTRYFGGIKLGTGGLARAYADCVKKAVEKAGIVTMRYSAVCKTSVSYAVMPKITALVTALKGNVLGIDYLSDGVDISFALPVDKKEDVKVKIADCSSGKSTVLVENYGYYEYENDN